MHRFWAPVIRPLLEACEPSVVVEVGAAAGAHTRRLAPWCEEHAATLHVVDPAPRFDHESAPWARSVIFHRDQSLAVLEHIGPVDVALLDGDHNWYTVIHELRSLANTARQPPLILCHDVEWPYGRRDLYYDPESIPEEHRHPWRRAGLDPGRAALVPAGGLNHNLANAEREGGPRNGVLTAIEDFLEESDDQYALTVLPVLHGLGILAPAARVDERPALAAQLQRWRTQAGWRKLAGLAEDDRQRVLARRPGREAGDAEPAKRKRAAAGGRREVAAPAGRDARTALPPALLASVQRGVMASRYRGREFLKSPFDVVLYLLLIERLRPRTVIEIGTKEGGSALWFADTLASHGIEAEVITIDTVPPAAIDDERVLALTGDALRLGDVLTEETLSRIARPLLVVEDSAHTFEACSAVLEFFDPQLEPGDYIVIEDGNVAFMPDPAYQAYGDGPNRAVSAFLESHAAAYAVDEGLCDHFGYNVTWAPNAWLRRL